MPRKFSRGGMNVLGHPRNKLTKGIVSKIKIKILKAIITILERNRTVLP
jgi:hypothetical protein